MRKAKRFSMIYSYARSGRTTGKGEIMNVRRRSLHIGLVLAIGSIALAGVGTGSASAAPHATYRLQLDAQPPTGEPWAFLRMFPGPHLTVHQGDVVHAAWDGTDTPHTTTFVPSSDPNAWRSANQGPGGPYAPIEPDSLAGGDDNELVLTPAVAFPSDPTCGTRDHPCAFDGTSVSNSGVRFSNPGSQPSAYTLIDAKPGTYSMLCLLHPGMQTLLTVVEPGTSIPSPKDVARKVRSQVRQTISVDAPVADARAQRVGVHNLGGGHSLWTISAGGFFQNVSANEYVNSGLTIHVGDQLKVNGNFEIHTATFPASSAATVPFVVPQCEVPGPDTPPPCQDPSTFQLAINNRALLPTASNDLRNPALFRNSGLLTDPTTSFTFVAKKPGTYTMVCLVHGPEMSTSVTVEG
jgi:plastocyanin